MKGKIRWELILENVSIKLLDDLLTQVVIKEKNMTHNKYQPSTMIFSIENTSARSKEWSIGPVWRRQTPQRAQMGSRRQTALVNDYR